MSVRPFVVLLLPVIFWGPEFVSSHSLQACPPQEKEGAAKQEDNSSKDDQDAQDTVTIRGQFVLNSELLDELDWESMQGSLGQLVKLEQPTFPQDWANMAIADRQSWLKSFYDTEAGKKLQAANQKKLEDRHQQEFRVRDEGKFIIYDVPQGRYQMRAIAQREVDGKTYVVQAFGEFVVGEVDELDFDKMPLDVLRLLKMGEQAPDISGQNSDGNQVSLADLRGKHVLLAFGLTANPDFVNTARLLKTASTKATGADQLNVLMVTVDEDQKVVAEFNRKHEVDWPCINLGKWDQAVLNQYGLKSVPSLWLLDPDGKIVLTGRQFLYEMNQRQHAIEQLVDEAIAGTLKIGEPETSANNGNSENDGQSDDVAPGNRDG